jgi:hypothetical protein
VLGRMCQRAHGAGQRRLLRTCPVFIFLPLALTRLSGGVFVSTLFFFWSCGFVCPPPSPPTLFLARSQECLTPKTTVELLEACKAGKPPALSQFGSRAMNGQLTCEGPLGKTTLKEPVKPKFRELPEKKVCWGGWCGVLPVCCD